VDSEAVVWKGRPSQWTNLGAFLACVFVLPIPLAIWRWLEVRCLLYEVTRERVRVTSGVLSRRLEELELYRVKDSTLDVPFLLRLVGLGNVVLRTSDQSHPVFVLRAIRNAATLRESIRGTVEKLREKRGVREVDFS
jgi:uncharacterized membrane protein YdbT with pleckstrin-like domain